MIVGVLNISLKITWLTLRVVYIALKAIALVGHWLTKGCLLAFGQASKTLGSARFSNLATLKRAGFCNGEGLIVGQMKGEFLYAPHDDHALITAPTNSGKTSCFVITNLLKLGDISAVVSDPKGECWAMTESERSMQGDVHLWAPFCSLSDCYNPMDYVRVGTIFERDDVELITSLIVPDSADSEENFWRGKSKEVLAGFILYVLHTRKARKRTMAEVRHLVTLKDDAFDEVLNAMARNKHVLIKRAGNTLLNQDGKLHSSVMATVVQNTNLWDSPLLTRATRKSDFSFAKLREQTGTVYLVVPPTELTTYGPALAMLSGLAIAEINRAQSTKGNRVTFMLDEFANLGRIKPFETAISIARAAGIQLCLFVQDMAQAKRVYGNGWESFEANCNTKIVFGINQIEEAKKLSATLGVKTVKTRSAGHHHGLTDVVPNSINGGTGEASRPLMTADEIMAMNQHQCIILQKGMRPILADKIHYSHPFFGGLYDQWNGKAPYENIEMLHDDTPQLTHQPILALPDPRNMHAPAPEIIELPAEQEAA